jgi:thiamine-phosphate pyrophosphorylase
MVRMRGLYPIVDLDTLTSRGCDALAFAQAVLTAKPALLQLRAKHQSDAEVLTLLAALKPLCQQAGTLLFANDRPDLAEQAGVDGVHVGQDDMPLVEVRRRSARLLVGVSTHDSEQLARALELAPSYVAFGPIFATRSKERPDATQGMAALQRSAERAREAGVPLVAIGGLTPNVAPELARAGVMAAVISDLLADGNEVAAVAARAQAWQRALATT